MDEYLYYLNELRHHGVKGMKWGVRRARKLRRDNYHEDYKRVHDKKSVKMMSDKELRDRNNRLQAERQYAQLTQKKSIGEKAVKAFIATAGTIVAVETAYKTYQRVGTAALDKVGDYVLKEVAKAF